MLNLPFTLTCNMYCTYCQVMDPYSMIYGIVSGCVLYLVPWIAMVVAMLLIQGLAATFRWDAGRQGPLWLVFRILES